MEKWRFYNRWKCPKTSKSVGVIAIANKRDTSKITSQDAIIHALFLDSIELNTGQMASHAAYTACVVHPRVHGWMQDLIVASHYTNSQLYTFIKEWNVISESFIIVYLTYNPCVALESVLLRREPLLIFALAYYAFVICQQSSLFRFK